MNTNTPHPKLKKILGIACLAVMSAASTYAATWNGGTMSYNTPSNWSTGLVPSPSAVGNAVNSAGLASVVQVNPGDPDWVLGNQDILLGAAAGASGSYLQNGPTVTLNFWFRMGVDGNPGAGGYAEVRAGTLNVGGQLDVGEVDVTTTPGVPSVFVSTNTGIINVGGELWVGNNFGADGTLNLGGTSRLTMNNWFAIGRNNSAGVVNLSGNASITKQGGGNITFAGIGAGTATLNQTGGAVTNETSETWLSENGTGFWNMTNGVASLGLLRFGAAGGNGIFNLVGGTLMVNQINMGNGSGLLNFNGGTLMARVSSPNFMSAASAVIQAGGAKIDSQGFSITIASTIQDDGSGGSLTKLGSGDLALTGFNTYTGPTLVNAGKLIVNETTTAANGSYTVAGGATLSVTPSTANAQFTAGSLTVAASSSLDFDLGAFGNPTLAPINLTGALTVNGAVTVNIVDNLPQLGQFPLVKYGSRSGSGSFAIGSLPIGVTATIVTNVGGSIDLNITAVSAPRWDGQVNGIWDIGTTANWIEQSTLLPATYANGNAVLFNDAASGTTSVTLGVTVTPGKVTVNNTNLNYSLSGNGKISGVASLVKQGAGSLALNTTNDYTGVTRIEGGTLSVTKLANGGVASAIGSSSAGATNLVLAGGTLSYSGPALTTDRGYTLSPGNSGLDAQSDMTFNGAINAIGNGNFAKSGNGTLYVKRTGANTLSAGGGGGAYNIANGKVVLDGSAGAQTNSVNGELWTGGATNTTSASLVLTNTTLNVSSWLSVGRGVANGATSSVALYNSNLRSGNGSLTYDNNIPSTQVGLLTLNGTSTYTNTGDGNFGESSGGTAIITLNDSSVMFNNNRLQFGWHTGGSGAGTGVLTVANSAKIIVNAWMSIGNEGGDGRVIVKDNGSLRCTDLNLCDVNTGNCDLLAQDNAALSCDTFFVGKGIGSVGTNTIRNNATITVANGTYIGATIGGQVNPAAGSGTGTINLSGGSLITTLVKGQADGGNNASISTVNFDGGKLIATPSGSDLVFNLTAANVLAGGAVIQINNNDVRAISQDLLNGGGGGGLTKLGTGTLSLNGTNTYTGSTVVTAGTLGGNGSIAGNVTVQSAGTITAGSATNAIGQLTIGGNLTIAGNVAVDVNTSLSPSNDVIAVTGTLSKTGAGTLTVNNLGPALQAGQKFFLFNKPVSGGASLTVSGGGAGWLNNLAVDGSITVLAGPAPTFNPASVATLPDGNKSVTATGTIGSTYKLYATTNVALTPITTTWTLLSSGTITTSPFTINDLTATNFSRRFYIFSSP